MSGKIGSYEEFFLFYLREHSHAGNRALHACGTALGIGILIAAFALHHPWFALLWVPVAYGCAWFGHFLLEGNKPATFRYPLWSLVSDFHMVGLMLTGRLPDRLARAQQSGATAGASAAVPE